MEYRIVEYSEMYREGTCLLLDRINQDGGAAADELMAAYAKAPEKHVSTKIALLVDDTVAGLANIWITSSVGDTATIGYEVDPEHRRKGIASSLIEAAVQEAESKGVKETYALIMPDNEASIAVVKNLGFETTTDIKPKDRIGFVKRHQQ